MKRVVLGPFNRVEGDLEVGLDVDAGRVVEARVVAPLYRGFEQILLGKAPMDVLVFVPRICGICSVAQSAAAAMALADAAGMAPANNGRLAANLVQAVENLADHLTHFYLFFMPDFAHAAYRGHAWFEPTAARFQSIKGSAPNEFLPARAGLMRAMGLLAGKWPHTLSLQPGGSAKPLSPSERIRLGHVLREFRGFLERSLYGDRLEAVAALAGTDQLAAWAEAHAQSDFGRFLALARELRLDALGGSEALMISYGAYRSEQGHLFARGVWNPAEGKPAPLDVAAIREDAHHAWYAEAEAPQMPATGSTVPLVDKHEAYTWCKAPRLDGRVAETGALARQQIAGHPLVRDLVRRGGSNVMSRVVARLVEAAQLLPAMEAWLAQLDPAEPYCSAESLPAEAEGVGLVEAARGALGHWLSIRRGRLHNYQIIAPTTWNFSPRDRDGRPGALEAALVGTPVAESGAPAVQHVVRSFDPCMVCTVH